MSHLPPQTDEAARPTEDPRAGPAPLLSGRARAALDHEPGARSVRLLRVALAVIAVAIVVQAALGFLGALTAAPLVVAILLVPGAPMAVAVALARDPVAPPSAPPPPRPTSPEPWTPAACAGAAAMVGTLAERSWAGLHRSTFLYDALSYHLHLPAAWRADGRLHVVPTPFGDPGAAYGPANAELLYHLLLAATGNCRLAHAGQLAFAALAALALYATARVLGAPRATGFGVALAFLLIPEIWQQIPTAMSDLGTAAFFLAALPFLLRLVRRLRPFRLLRRAHGTLASPSWTDLWPVWRDLLALGVALGLLVGTKYLSVILSLPLLAWTVLVLGGAPTRRLRDRGYALLVVAGLALACGGFWYVRNAWVTGNPLFPATLQLGPWTLAPGLSTAATRRLSPYHVALNDIQVLLELFRETGWGFLGGWGLALVTLRSGRWLALGAVLLALGWVVVPYQESRFFFSLWGIAAVTLAAAALRAPRAGAAAVLMATLGSLLQFPTPGRLALVALAAAGALVGPRAVRALGRRVDPVGLKARAGVAAGAAVVVLFALVAWARAHPEAAPYAVGDAHDAAWAWMRAQPHHPRSVAYAGSNLPLPLWGARLENRVAYVNVAGGPFAAPHDFMHVPRTAPTMRTPEPAPERAYPSRAVWLSNLRARGIQLLVVVALYPDVQRTIAHDAAGFPVERTWADSDPEHFELAFSTAGSRIYAVHLGGAP